MNSLVASVMGDQGEWAAVGTPGPYVDIAVESGVVWQEEVTSGVDKQEEQVASGVVQHAEQVASGVAEKEEHEQEMASGEERMSERWRRQRMSERWRRWMCL